MVNNSNINNFQALTGGHDAYFVACQNWLGTADGVGQWSLEGIFQCPNSFRMWNHNNAFDIWSQTVAGNL